LGFGGTLDERIPLFRWSKSEAEENAARPPDVLARLFFDSPHGAVALDASGRILGANAAFVAMLGLEQEAVEGRLLTSLCAAGASGPGDVEAALEQVVQGRATKALAAQRYARADGTVASCRLTLGPVCEGGRFDYALVSIEDLSSGAAAEATLGESEQRFRTLVELSPDPVLFFVRGLVAHANPAALRLLGAADVARLLGRKSTDLIHPDSISAVAARGVALMKGESVPALEEKWVRMDGEVVVVESNVARVPLAAEKAFVVILRDLRERKEDDERRRKEREARAASHEAKEREQWLRQIIDLLPVCVYARDERGVFVLANRAFAQIVGAEPRDVVGRTLEELGVPLDVATTTREHDRAALASDHASLVCDELFVDRAGRRRVFETNRLAFSLRERATVLCAAADVTEKKRLEGELLQSQKLDAIGRLAGGIAHDFNNLLTVLVTSADELARRSPDESDPDVERIHEVASRATALTQHLLAFARKSAVEASVVSVNDLVRDVVRLLARVLGEHIAVQTVLDPDAKDVFVDRSKMERVLVNLAVNARDAMERGGTLTIATRNEPSRQSTGGDWVAVSVVDTGVGMSAETRAHLFEPFFTTKGMGEGTGLGLATCFGIVDQLGGRIEVESELGQGTTFRLLLPATAVPAPTPAPAPAPAAAAAEVGLPAASLTRRAPKAAAPVPSGSETILVLDDDPHVLSATTRVLKQLGYRVLVASSPDEGIAIARSHDGTIDLLLTDVLMPGKTGPETARAVRAVRPSVRVLFMSGYSGDVLAVEGEDVLRKPYSRSEIATKLREAFGESGSATSRSGG
jgi:two-component system, cell cycle sensor histidine kinase and response regulator CckA